MLRSLKEAADELAARLNAGDRHLSAVGLKGAARSLLLREIALRCRRPVVVIAPLETEAQALASEISFFLDEQAPRDALGARVHLMRAWELKPFVHLSPPTDAQASELTALFALMRLEAPVVVASVEVLMKKTLAPHSFESSIIRLATGELIDLEALGAALEAAGYQRVPQVEELGDFSVRGGIVDLFCPLYTDPVRLELEDDMILSIRRFEAATQRSLGELREATVIAVRFVAPSMLKREHLWDRIAVRCAEIGLVRKEAGELEEQVRSGLLFPGVELLMPYLYGEPFDSPSAYLPADALICMVEPDRVSAEAVRYTDLIAEQARAAQEKPIFYPEPELSYLSGEEFEALLKSRIRLEVGALITAGPVREGFAPPIEIDCHQSLKLAGTQLDGARISAPSFEPLVAELGEVRRAEGKALMVVEGAAQAGRLHRHLEAYQVEVNRGCESFTTFLESSDYRPAILNGEISSGAALAADGLYIYSEEDIFGEPRVHRRSPRRIGGGLLNLEELSPAAFIVHIDHGIGRYRGLKHLKVAGEEGDFLNLEYLGGDALYVPVERINLVQRHVGGDGAEPKLDKLGSGSWEKVKRRTRQSVLAMASELLDIYAARETTEGHSFLHPGAEYERFAEGFEFEETPDQLAAIDEVIRDMARPKPMDRLICGDAGFGKTEVALRAALIAVMDGRQVAMLSPTTVLAEQHWNTFRARFQEYPVRVEMVSRFRSAKENRAMIEDLRRGLVDIVVGTHRLLQSDVEFKRLGLLIIDEEHRFGVADKERIKRLRKLVEVLTLTATPIPRTLHMALLGIRDLSVIQTPPSDRQAVRTFIAHFDDGLLRDAIMRELNRGGQVFFVHNEVRSIDYIARHLRALVPEAKIAVAHGQMRSRDLEAVMRDFIERRVPVLVCSAIIESGLDIPNANTIIINRADHFGLAQLYQLRGRVGRSRQRAYAYLLIPGEHIISRDAKRRIEALRELAESESGTGFKLSLADLEHRGAGNLLGREQSGQITAVGFELYTEMMEQTIHELRGEPYRPDFEPELRLGIPAYIPDQFVADERERLTLYRRMARAEAQSELDEMQEEMRDRFGPLPTLVDNLFAAMNLHREMKQLMIVSMTLKGHDAEIRFHPEAPLDPARLAALAQGSRGVIRLTPAMGVVARIGGVDGDYAQLIERLNALLRALADCEKLENRSATAAKEMFH